MAENIQRSTGRPQEYKFDRGGMPAEMGPYIGIVVNNVDNTRSGRLHSLALQMLMAVPISLTQLLGEQ